MAHSARSDSGFAMCDFREALILDEVVFHQSYTSRSSIEYPMRSKVPFGVTLSGVAAAAALA